MSADYPDIRHSGSTKTFDKDTGWTEKTVIIEQDGGMVTITEVTAENGTEVERNTGKGRISKLYHASHLAQVTMEDGERRYLNLKTKEFDNSAELIFRRSSFPGFDYKNADHLGLICCHLHAIASVFLQTPALSGDARPEWTRREMSEQGRLGDFMQIDATLHEDGAGIKWFGAWFTVCNTPPGYSVRTYLRREGNENWDIVVTCPPEWHPKVNGVIDGIVGIKGA